MRAQDPAVMSSACVDELTDPDSGADSDDAESLFADFSVDAYGHQYPRTPTPSSAVDPSSLTPKVHQAAAAIHSTTSTASPPSTTSPVFAHEGEAPPPDYASATAGHPRRSSLREPSRSTDFTMRGSLLQSMSDRSPHQTGPDEETSLLNARTRRQRPGSCLGRICGLKIALMVTLVILIAIFTGSWGTEDGADEHQRDPIGTPNPSHPGSTFPTTCSFDFHSDTLVVDFESLHNFSFVESIQHLAYFDSEIHGTIHVRSATAEQESDARVSISYFTTNPWQVERSVYNKQDESFVLQHPILRDVASDETHTRPCMGVYITIELRPGLQLTNWELKSAHLDIKTDADLFQQTRTDENFQVNDLSTFNAVEGAVSVSYWSSRKTIISTKSGTISGTFALRDLLAVQTHSGTIHIAVDPRPADPEAPQPALFTATSVSGTLTVHFPTTDSSPLPLRTYITRISTVSATISGTYILGATTSLQTTSGTISASLLPLHRTRDRSTLHVISTSSSIDLRVLAPHSFPGPSFAALPSSHDFRSRSGSLRLRYPDAWEGAVSGRSLSGSVALRGRDLRWDGGRRPVRGAVSATKGRGNGTIVFETVSGSVDVLLGDGLE